MSSSKRTKAFAQMAEKPTDTMSDKDKLIIASKFSHSEQVQEAREKRREARVSTISTSRSRDRREDRQW